MIRRNETEQLEMRSRRPRWRGSVGHPEVGALLGAGRATELEPGLWPLLVSLAALGILAGFGVSQLACTLMDREALTPYLVSLSIFLSSGLLLALNLTVLLGRASKR
ncbi:MAG: hypothetical protein A2Y74_06830 [Actinobacteria bacterium RBG_13_63_9]|nr:MAG: hypothetical protein A2Y74_06830 [Actinobacteria bacterium RBG_13_63_9]